MNNHLIFATCIVKRNIGSVQEIICKPLLNHVLLISSTNNKLIVAIACISLHDMPQNRHTANLNHRLRFIRRFFGNTCSKTTSKNNNFHSFSPLLIFSIQVFRVHFHLLCKVFFDVIILNRRLAVVDQINLLRNNINCCYLMMLAQQSCNRQAHIAGARNGDLIIFSCYLLLRPSSDPSP